MALAQKEHYTLSDIYALPDGQRAELIDGEFYAMAPPSRLHQQERFQRGYLRIYHDHRSVSCKLRGVEP